MKTHFVITGAGRGIGFELAKQALAGGAQVTALAREPLKAAKLQALHRDYPDTLKLLPADVTSDASIESLLRMLEDRAIDVLINNAGAYLDDDANFERLPLQNVMDNFAINAVGPMRVTRALLPHLKKSKQPKLIHITSLMGSITDNQGGGSYAYRMSKAALNMFAKSFSRDYPAITTLVIHPGWVKTDMGGDNAPTLPSESASGILKVIVGSSPKKSGHFYDFEGNELPW
jgi:NAD(P)-dependent dehydrogenase (short-subunit alcohol dehydrogenase family)